MNPGTRQLLREAVSWGVVAIVVVGALLHFETLKTGAEQMLGLPTPTEIAEAQRTSTPARPKPPASIGSVVEIEAADNGHFNAEVNIVALDEMAGKVADFYEADVDAAVDGLSSLLEPLIMVILGVLVGGLVIAMYLPIFKLGAVI